MTDNIIEEVLRHDAAMTGTTWYRAGFYNNRVACRDFEDEKEKVVADCGALNNGEWNAAGIAYYRTAAPKLARALKVAMEELQSPVSHGPNGPVYSLKHIDALADIAKILSEP